MNTIKYQWLKLLVWYHTNFCFTDSEVQMLSIRFIRKNTIDTTKLNIVADMKHWVVVID